MEKERQKEGAEAEAAAAAAAPDDLLVYVETSLVTRIVALASPDDTAASFKRKLEVQHLLTLPDSGVIHVQALRARREGLTYQLTDSMPLAVLSGNIDAERDIFLEALVQVESHPSPPPPPQNGIPAPQLAAPSCPTQTDLDHLAGHFVGLCKNVTEKPPSNTVSEMVD